MSLPSLLYCGLASHKIPICRGTSSSAVPLATIRHCYWPWPRWIWFPSSNGVYLIPILIWFFHLRHFLVSPFRCGVADQNFVCISNLTILVTFLAHPFILYEVGGHTNGSRLESLFFFNSQIYDTFLCPYAQYLCTYIKLMRDVLKLSCSANLCTLTLFKKSAKMSYRLNLCFYIRWCG